MRDLESRLGCIVNGQRIPPIDAKPGDESAAPLHLGDNEIIAGGIDSPVRFTLRLRRGAIADA